MASPRSIILQVPRRKASEAERMREAFMAEITATKRRPSGAPDAGGQPRAQADTPARRFLRAAADHPGRPMTQLYQILDAHPAQGKRIVDGLEAEGLIRIHEIPRQGRGGRCKVVELLDAARAPLESMGSGLPVPVLKGGFRHDLYGRWLANWLGRQGSTEVGFEKTLGRKTFDLAWRMTTRDLAAAEICLSGSAARNVEQLLRGLENEGLAKLWAVFEDGRLMAQVMAEINRAGTESDSLGRVIFKRASEFMPDEV